MSHKEQIDRKLDYLHRNKIAYKLFPTTDVATNTFYWGWYHKNGTFECYDLFNNKYKINTRKSFKWHLLAIRYINKHLTPIEFKNISKFISNKQNGFVTFTIPTYMLNNVLEEINKIDINKPPSNKIRKVIFKDSTGLSTKEKCRIVGELIGKSKSVENEDIYECMLYINNINKKITIASLAKMLSCSSRTIHRNMDKELKKEKELLNEHYEKI